MKLNIDRCHLWLNMEGNFSIKNSYSQNLLFINVESLKSVPILNIFERKDHASWMHYQQ